MQPEYYPTGKRRHRGVIQRRVTRQNGVGGRVTTWETIRTVRIEVRPISAKERLQAEQVQSTLAHRAYIRFAADADNPQQPFVRAADSLIYKGNRYDIIGVIDVGEGRRFLQLELQQGVAP